jgi:hypothetical protein
MLGEALLEALSGEWDFSQEDLKLQQAANGLHFAA